MPFKSEKQRRYLWANEPEIARDWTDTYGSRIEKNDGGITRLGYEWGGPGGKSPETSSSGGTHEGGYGKGEPPGGGDPGMKYTAPPKDYDKSIDTGPDRFKLAEENRIKEELEKEKEKEKDKFSFKTPLMWALDKGKKFAAWNNLKKRQDFLKQLGVGPGGLFEDEDYLLSSEGLAKLKELGYSPGWNPEDTGGGGGQALPYYPQDIHSGTGGITNVTDATGTALDEFDVARQGLIFAADGGRAGYAGGGDVRQAYGLGKLVKKAKKAIGKIAKSPIGKAALAGLGMYLTRNMGPMGKAGGWKKYLFGAPGTGTLAGGSMAHLATPVKASTHGLLGNWGLTQGAGSMMPTPLGGILGASLAGGLYTAAAPDEQEEPSWYDKWLADMQMYQKQIGDFPVGRGESIYERTAMSADGGRIGYAKGGNDEEEGHRSAALSAMYGLRKNAQEGGLMDMGGMEKDYREEGGFVPIGGQERADDVPARLSKNEFVFTADAVRAAGGGDIDKGAEVMENVMNNLEQGGQVSEESQGLEGARNMFATAQRLEGVL